MAEMQSREKLCYFVEARKLREERGRERGKQKGMEGGKKREKKKEHRDQM